MPRTFCRLIITGVPGLLHKRWLPTETFGEATHILKTEARWVYSSPLKESVEISHTPPTNGTTYGTTNQQVRAYASARNMLFPVGSSSKAHWPGNHGKPVRQKHALFMHRMNRLDKSILPRDVSVLRGTEDVASSVIDDGTPRRRSGTGQRTQLDGRGIIVTIPPSLF